MSDYQALFENSPDLHCIISLKGVFLDINDAFCSALGFSKAEFLVKSCVEFIHPEDAAKTYLEIRKLNSGVETINFVNRYRHANGHYLLFSWSANVDNETSRIYATARDVTREKTLKSRLTQIEKALNQKSILAVTDRQGVITDVNQNFCQISGYSREELIGNTHQMINSGYHSKAFFQELWRTISSGNIWQGTIKNKRKDGNHYYVQSIITPLFDHEGKITSYISIRQDMTKTVESSVQLSRTLEILNDTNSIAKVGGWELEVSTGELTWTDETFRILEVEKKDDQKPILPEGIKLFIPEHQPIIEQAVNNAIEKGEPYSLLLKALTAKGNERWVQTNGKANYINGEIVTLSGTIQDVHEQKITEEKYEMERLKALQNAKLASLGELAAGVAHEINNPLGIISAVSESILLLPYDKQEISEKMDLVLKSVDRIAHIVKGLKRFSRTDEQKVRNPVNLNSIVEEALSLLIPRIKRESIELRKNLIDTAIINADEIEIEQVIINLMHNAIDAISMLEEKWISVESVNANGSVELIITDSGTGIPEEIKDKIFEPFYTSKEVGKGTGLGLSISKGILEEHDATISISSDSGHTEFRIVFPLLHQERSCKN